MDDATQLPSTLQQAIIFFQDPDVALKVASGLRWQNGVTCPHCQSKAVGFVSTRRIWKCKNKECRKQFSVKTGTIMEDSPLGLDKWLCAIWMVANCKNGVSSYEIHRALGITQKTAWFLLQRIRLAMQSGSFTKLSGEVEVDETFIGGKARNMHAWKRRMKIKGRGSSGKAIVLGMLERGGEIRAKVIADTTKQTLHQEIKAEVSPVTKGSAKDHTTHIYSDGHDGYLGLEPDFVHQMVDHAVEYVRGNVSTNGVENFWTLLKRSIKGTYVSVEPFHLFRYVDEQAFRYNHRKDKDGDRFLCVVANMQGKRVTYKGLTGKLRGKNNEKY